MRVNLDASFFQGPARPVDQLGLIALADHMGHVMASPLQAVESWAQTLATNTAEAVLRLLDTHRERVTLLSASTLAITVQAARPTTWASASLHLDDARHFLRAPLELLVENERADWSFLRRLASTSQRVVLDEAIARGALQVRQGGGITEIEKSVRALYDQIGHAQLDAHRRIRRLRTWVMFDRDADRADARQPGWAASTASGTCGRTASDDPWPLKWHQLRRRHIECYLPDDVLTAWASKQGAACSARAAALVGLRQSDPDAAYSVHMKSGLQKDLPKSSRTALNPEGQSADPQTRRAAEATVQADWKPPWDAVAPEVRADLLEGFGNIGELFTSAPAAQDPLFAVEFDRYEHLNAHQLVESIVERV